mgnify:CR=1 FL=1
MIRVSRLRVEYLDAGKTAVDDLSFEVERGERLVLLGPSGCGKTTVLKAILGLLRPREARVAGSVETGSSRLSAVFQRPALFPWLSVEKNISFPLLAAGRGKDARVKELTASLLRMGGLEGTGATLPHQLSAGMQQRVSFLRALANSPDLVVMDEPFSSLDVAVKGQILKDFLALLRQGGITALFVTHDIREALAMGDRLLVLTASPARQKKQYSLKGLSAGEKESLLEALAAAYEN